MVARTLRGLMRESFVTMKPAFRLTICAFAAALLTFSVGSHALTLGRARGAAIVAQPLSVSIAVSGGTDEDVSDLCFEADVFYGESKVDGSRVSVASDAAVAGHTWSVRINSRLPVDEPVVTVYLRSTCAAKASRRYVFLADVAPDNLSPVPALPSVSLSSGVAPTAVSKPVNEPLGKNNSMGTVDGASAVPVTRAKRERSEKTPVASVSNAPVAKPSGSSKSRLKLAPLDLSIERDPMLRTTPELLSTPTEDSQKRGEAIALWRALNLTPEDVMRDAARLQGLEASVRELSAISKSNQRQMQELKGALESSERARYNNPVVWGLGAGVLLLLAGGVWLIRRQNQSNNAGTAWWRSEVGLQAQPEDVPAVDLNSLKLDTLPPGGEQFVSDGNIPSVLRQAALDDVDIDLDLEPVTAPKIPVADVKLVNSPSAAASMAPMSRTMGLRDFSPSMSGSLRSMNTQEMLDIRQQAEFFMTLGQYEDAIALLEGHIADAAEANPLVYLDLLKILHTLSRKDAFDRYRAEFNAIFTGQVAEYKDFTRSGDGLETYPELCAHLCKLWPSREALNFMEDCLVRKPGAAATMLFELEAFKELLMLHGVATRLVEALDGAPVTFSASKPLVSQAAVFHTGPSPLDVSLPLNVFAPAAVDFELDIPLDIPEPIAVPPADNLIDFDASGLAFNVNKEKRPG